MKTNQTKRDEATERQQVWAALSPKQQLADLDRRLGEGVGAVKQRARLAEKINGSEQS